MKLPARLQDPVQHSAAFIQLLLDRIQDPSTAPISRTASAAYLASFLARATFVPRSVLLTSLKTHWLQQEPSSRLHGTLFHTKFCLMVPGQSMQPPAPPPC